MIQVKIHNLLREQRLIEQTNRCMLRAESILIPPDRTHIMSPIVSNHGATASLNIATIYDQEAIY
jgi:hypothetical protein